MQRAIGIARLESDWAFAWRCDRRHGVDSRWKMPKTLAFVPGFACPQVAKVDITERSPKRKSYLGSTVSQEFRRRPDCILLQHSEHSFVQKHARPRMGNWSLRKPE